MEEKAKSPSFYVLNVAGLVLVLSVVGSTLRFAVISVTLISWLQTQWLAYTSALKRWRSARLAAAADEDRTQRRRQIADISEAIGQNVISLLDQRRRELMLRLDQETGRKRQSYKQDIVRRITDDLAQFQESERIKDEQRVTLREYKKTLDDREQKLKDSERELQTRQKKLNEQEQRIKDEERVIQARKKDLQELELKARAVTDNMRKLRLKQEEVKIQSRVVSQPATVATPYPALVNKPISLPADLLEFADDLKSYHFTCIGTTKKGTRCGQSMISNFDKSSATARIAKMASPGPGDIVFFDMKSLRELADWMLCPRWHRDKLPQGAEIASRWYYQLSDARAQLESEGYKTPPSAGAPNVFGSASTGSSTGTTASSFGSSVQSVSMSYTSQDYQSTGFQFGRSTTTTSALGQQTFGGSAARNLTPVFEFMSQGSDVTKKGFSQW
ncbi:hypothetical protein TCE0_039r13035 [Talaromyces pinophilus]|uniref:Uncharacterized protein n=1 Tax=Talaromyces pinophilus TaxID=128442 RepID=A0A6N4SLI0_TALPI|nr:hypothetical protein TCE0_039r13035 [Talaromyces pinophilus]